MYLTENNLSGTIPGWVFTSTKDVDISCNRFTWDASRPCTCAQGFTNLVESCSSSINAENTIFPCLLKDFPCIKSKKQQIYSLHINCGGKEVNINNTIKYELDAQTESNLHYHNGGNWAFSSTGNFLDDPSDSDVYILSNTSNLQNISTSDTELYTKARTATISLTYYGLCLLNGNYNVTLHFAEIVFTQDNTFNSLGKRVFDVYVQGELKIKDFDIAKEAGGTGRAVLKRYAVDVTTNTLKIQLYWAGKGTTGIPNRGSYGPIISAISVDPNFKPPNFRKKPAVGLIVGTVGGGLFIVVLVILILWRKGYIMGENTELSALDLNTANVFTQRQIKAATKNFHRSNKLGEGGFGCVYKGLLSDGTSIAVKRLSAQSKQGAREFVNEICIISTLRHPNLVRLYGCSQHGSQLSLVYEYMENNSLSQALFGDAKVIKAQLAWPVRLRICLGIARGLIYLHEESPLRIIHRDIKASNVLLDENFNPKISDFGLAKLYDDKNTEKKTTRIVGTMGYMAPEYARTGFLTIMVDVYSFGIMALEIVSGLSINECLDEEQGSSLLDLAFLMKKREDLLRLVDPNLGSEYSSEEALTILNVAILCIDATQALRPTMSETLDMLEGRTSIQDFLNNKRSSMNLEPSWVHPLRNPTENLPTSVGRRTTSFVTESFITEA